MGNKKWIKQEKLRERPVSELLDRASEMKASLFNSRFQRSAGKLENYRAIPQAKRRLAALLTILRERKSQAGGDAK